MTKEVVFVVSSPMMVNFFLIPQLNYLAQEFNITIITGNKDNNVILNEVLLSKKIKIIKINMQRKISVFSDFLTFFKLFIILKKNNFDILHSISPKSGLLAQLAAFFVGVKIRIHTFTGQVWASKSGMSRFLLKLTDILIVKISSKIIVDSYSQRSFLMNENIVNHDNSRVLLNGSISGINKSRFKPSKTAYDSFRRDHGIRRDALIILFIGRLTKDKGVIDLIHAFQEILTKKLDCYLLLVGPVEDQIVKQYIDKEEYRSNILPFEYTDKPEYYMQVSDFLCLPSLREGFGNVVLEAAMCQLPAVVSNIYGLKDVIEENSTALTFSPGNVEELKKSLLTLIKNPTKINEMGENAIKRAEYLFSTGSINESLALLYSELLTDFSKEHLLKK